jgi:hypothetical protein
MSSHLAADRIVLKTNEQEIEDDERELDRLILLAEAAYDLGMTEEYAVIEEAAERLGERLLGVSRLAEQEPRAA